MKLSTPVKALVGVATAIAVLVPFVIAPLAAALAFVAAGVPAFVSSSPPDFRILDQMFPMMFAFGMVVMPIAACSGFLQLALQVFYLVHLLSNDELTGTYRILFVLGVFFMGYIAMPLYFFLYLWGDKPMEPKAADSASSPSRSRPKRGAA